MGTEETAVSLTETRFPIRGSAIANESTDGYSRDMKVETPELDATTARQEFAELVAGQATSCLWFMRDPQKISVVDPAADTVLKAIIGHGTRAAWQQAKRLQTWRSRNFK